MKVKINDYLTQKGLKTEGLQIPDCEIDPYWSGIRVMPSYIMTGKNLLIEPFKRDCVADAIKTAMKLI